MRVLGVDYGLRKVGLAMGESVLRLASPLEVWENKEEETMAKDLARFAEAEGVELIVVGMPRKASGEITQQGKRHEAFVSRLRSFTPIPIVTVDESFTSKESRRLQEETGSDVPEDALSAMLILEEYFETLV